MNKDEKNKYYKSAYGGTLVKKRAKHLMFSNFRTFTKI